MLRDFLKLFIFCFFLSEINASEHYIRLNNPRPIVARKFGWKELFLRKMTSEWLYLNEGETNILYCQTGFICDDKFIYEKQIELKCFSNGIGFDTEDKQYRSFRNIKCIDAPQQKIFESSVALSSCTNDTTLVIGTEYGIPSDSKTVGLCYDFEKGLIKFVSFLAYRHSNIFEDDEPLFTELDELHLSNVIDHFDQYFDFPGVDGLLSLKSDIEFRILDPFPSPLEIATLLQGTPINYKFQAQSDKSYDYMLRIIWLKRLMSGNWVYFHNALEMRSKSGSKYTVRIGVSGIVEVPKFNKYNDTQLVQLVYYPVTRSSPSNIIMPKYIWVYLRQLTHPTITDSQPEEFVVIAYNSPLIKVHENLLCNSMCHEVPWLSEGLFGKLHLVPSYGLMICCRPADVADKLENFHYKKNEILHSSEFTPQPETTDDTTPDYTNWPLFNYAKLEVNHDDNIV